LMTVGVHLPRLLERAAIANDLDLYLKKLASLARLAVSAGVQKRQALRRDEADQMLERGLLRERARLMVAPLGLDTAVRKLTGAGLCDAKEALEAGRKIVHQLHEVLVAEGRRRLVDCVLDTPDGMIGSQELAGFALVPPRQQLRAAGRLHGVTGTGTAVLGLESRTSVDELVELLNFAWRETEVARLRVEVHRRLAAELQPTLLP
jgi:hypothetical protein